MLAIFHISGSLSALGSIGNCFSWEMHFQDDFNMRNCGRILMRGAWVSVFWKLCEICDECILIIRDWVIERI